MEAEFFLFENEAIIIIFKGWRKAVPLSFTKKTSRKPLDSGEAAFSAALWYLSRRPYTRFELESKLRARGAEPRCVEEALASLAERGLLDEEKLAEAYIHYRSAISLRGPFCVRRELLARGLDRELTESALSRWYDGEVERRAVKLFLEKEARRAGAALPEASEEDFSGEKEWEKLRRKLVSRGFSMSMIDACLAEFHQTKNS